VVGRTTNGGLDVKLAGSAGTGRASISRPRTAASTSTFPRATTAKVETGTTNGDLRVDFPITWRADLRKDLAFDSA
jgi:hypothetical protein